MVFDAQAAYKIDNLVGKVFKDTTLGTTVLQTRTGLDKVLKNSAVKSVRGIYNFVNDGGAIGTISLKDSYGEAISIPAGAIAIQCVVSETVAVTGSTGATISLGLTTDIDILGATGFASFASITATSLTGSGAAYFKTVAVQPLKMTIATAAITAGALDVFLLYLDPTA